MKHLSFAFALLVGLFAANSAGAEIRIGTAGPLSGQYADFGKQIVRGAQAAVDDINAMGGVNGEQLVLDIADDGCDPKKALEAAHSLVEKGVVFVAGHYCSFASIPAAPLYAQAGIVMISPSATHPQLTDEGGWNVHRVCARDDAQGTYAGEYLARQYRSARIAIVDDGSPYGKGLTDNVRKALSAAGIKDVLSATFKTGDKDFTALVSQLNAALPGVVYAAGYHPEVGLLVSEMRRQSMTALLVSGDTLVTDEFWTIAGEAAEGSIMTFPPDPMKSESAAAVVAKFKAAGFSPEGYTLYAYAAVQAWAQAAQATGGTEGRKIGQWLRAGNTVNTVVGELALDARGDVKNVKYDWFKWTAGKYVIGSVVP